MKNDEKSAASTIMLIKDTENNNTQKFGKHDDDHYASTYSWTTAICYMVMLLMAFIFLFAGISFTNWVVVRLTSHLHDSYDNDFILNIFSSKMNLPVDLPASISVPVAPNSVAFFEVVGRRDTLETGQGQEGNDSGIVSANTTLFPSMISVPPTISTTITVDSSSSATITASTTDDTTITTSITTTTTLPLSTSSAESTSTTDSGTTSVSSASASSVSPDFSTTLTSVTSSETSRGIVISTLIASGTPTTSSFKNSTVGASSFTSLFTSSTVSSSTSPQVTTTTHPIYSSAYASASTSPCPVAVPSGSVLGANTSTKNKNVSAASSSSLSTSTITTFMTLTKSVTSGTQTTTSVISYRHSTPGGGALLYSSADLSIKSPIAAMYLLTTIIVFLSLLLL